MWHPGHGDARPCAECSGQNVLPAADRLLQDGARTEHAVPLQKGLDRGRFSGEAALGDGRL